VLLHTSSADSFEGDGNNEYISFEPRRAGREYVGIGLTLLSVSFCCKCKNYHWCFIQVLMLISLAHVKKRMVKQWLVLVGPIACQQISRFYTQNLCWNYLVIFAILHEIP